MDLPIYNTSKIVGSAVSETVVCAVLAQDKKTVVVFLGGYNVPDLVRGLRPRRISGHSVQIDLARMVYSPENRTMALVQYDFDKMTISGFLAIVKAHLVHLGLFNFRDGDAVLVYTE